MKKIKTTLSLLLFIALLFSCFGISNTAEAKVKLKATKKTVTIGKTVKVKITGAKKDVKWSVSNSRIRIIAANKKRATVLGVSKGSATLKAKTGGKTFKCKFNVKTAATKSETNVSKEKFDETEAEKMINKDVYELNGSVFVLLKSEYKFPTSITADCYFFDSNGNPVETSYSYCFQLENGREGLLEFEAPESGYSKIDIKYDFFQSYAYIKNKSIIDNVSVSANIVDGYLGREIALTVSNGSNYEISACSILIKYYDKNGELVYFDSEDLYDIKSGDYQIEKIFEPYNYNTYEDIEYDKFEVSVSTAYY